MKKLFAILLAGWMLLSFAACGNNVLPADSKGTAPAQSENVDESIQSIEASSETEESNAAVSLADALKVYGFTEDDFSPEGFKELNTYTLNGKAGEIQSMLSFYVAVDGEPTVNDTKAWYEDLYRKAIGLSDTDKLYANMQGSEEFSSFNEVIDASPTLTEHPAFNCYYPYLIGENRAYLQFKVGYTPEDNAYSVFIWLMNYIR